MRLEKIKLAGFKSFVDPTTVPMPSNLVGIVGPNGCGKSNVIDAVRWVMGEISAKMLRGESMADVIFNGSSARKPVGTATIELLFDNSDGMAGGQYAQYNQISVKRQVSRDGQSSYFLNGVRCRRRDITDLFLGTGLGPRSYAIIEQGMISRLIEAKPEELRVFLEEAAGISKYKERRRETENRIRHTRENLDRLNDLREEVSKQLQHLNRQAATAEKYQQLKEQERRLQAELLALRWRTLAEDLKLRDQAIRQSETEQEAAIALQRRLEAEIEQDRERHAEAGEQFNEVQGRYYALGAEVSRLEQAIQYARDARQRQQQDLEQLKESLQEVESHRDQDQRRLLQLREALDKEVPLLEEARAAERISGEQLAQAEEAMHQWQDQWERFNQEATEPAQTAQVERTRINHLEQQQESLARRTQRFAEELERLIDPRLAEEIRELEVKEAAQEEALQAFQERLDTVLQRIAESREAGIRQSQELDEKRAQLQSATGRRASLETLQQAALGKQSDHVVTQWLDDTGLTDAARLAQHLDVEERWRGAVEVVLGFHLQAVCVDSIAGLKDGLQALPAGNISLIETATVDRDGPRAEPGRLLGFVESPFALQGLLGNIHCADDLDQALAMRGGLGTHESVVTPDGLWVGPDWVRLSRGVDETGGVLAREQELRQLARVIQDREELSGRLAADLEQNRTQQRELEASREGIQAELNGVNRTLSELRSMLSGKRTRVEHLRQRRQHIEEEKAEVEAQMQQGSAAMEEARARLHKALDAMDHLGERRDELVQRRDGLRSRLDLARDESQQHRSRSHQIALTVESMRSSQTSLEQNLERMLGQLRQFTQRRTELQESIEGSEQPIQEQQEQLQTQLERRIEVEKELVDVRRTLEDIDAALRGRDQSRLQAEERVQLIRAEMDQSRMQRQEVLVRARTLEERLKESGFEATALFEDLPEDADEQKWQEQVERMGARIQRLGAINLAAIDEYAEQSERMEYLNAQYEDVSRSLETLESAIHKIDRETRTRFKETFDRVNGGLQDMFPKLFGGGHSYLELTGEDLLDTGVAVMARPPGKRNSSIHLLSGGEKALTAVALVFAIFKLNPAPFCMLDEVDAPLDDANVGRFCKLVQSMSEQVQFIFITHNKVTMEVADHLTGVTMNEPGVSRLVSVDVDEAARLAAL